MSNKETAATGETPVRNLLLHLGEMNGEAAYKIADAIDARLSASAPKSAGEWVVEVSHGCEQWVWKPAQRTESAAHLKRNDE